MILTLNIMIIYVKSKIFEEYVNVHILRKNRGWYYIGRMTLNPGKISGQLHIKLDTPQTQTK